MTEKLLMDNKVFEKDKTVDDSYNQAKFYFDTLHQRFIDSTLVIEHTRGLSFDGLATFLETKNKKIISLRKEAREAREIKKDTKTLQKKIRALENEIDKKKIEFYESIRVLLDDQAEQWKKSYIGKKLEGGSAIKFGKKKDGEEKKNEKGVGFLTSAGVLQILKYEFPESKEPEFQVEGWPSLYVEEQENQGNKRYIFDSFDKFSGYLTKFQETRRNVYADNGIATALATRMVSNFEIFLANKKAFENKYLRNHHEIGFKRADIFEIINYKEYLLQSGIESYNEILGQLNKAIKEYRDKKASEAKQQKDRGFKKFDYSLFKTLDKQILGKVEKEKQLIEATETENEEQVFVKRFIEFMQENEKRFLFAKEDFMKKFSADEFALEYAGVYVKNSTINTISRRWFLDGYTFEKNLPQASKNKKEGDVIKVKKFVTFVDIKEVIEKLEGNPFKEEYYKKQIIQKDSQDLWAQCLAVWKFEFENLFRDIKKENGDIIMGYESCHAAAEGLNSFSKERKPEEIAVVKNYADASLRIFQMMKYIALDERDMGKLSGISTDFYAELDEYSKDFKFNKYYDAFRNFITKKPFDEDKMKLNFDHPNLGKGFTESKTEKSNAGTQYGAYLFRKKNDYGKWSYFLGISKNSKLFSLFDQDDSPDFSGYERLNYYQAKGDSIFGISYKGDFKHDRDNLPEREVIRKIKDALSSSRVQEIKQLKDQQFSSVKDFQKKINEILKQKSKIFSYKPVSIQQIEAAANHKHPFYLFEVHVRDFSLDRKDEQKNIHTRYFETLMSAEQSSIDLGTGELFVREPSVQVKGRKEQIVTTKGNNISEYLREKYGVDKQRYNRYSERKYLFNLSIVLNVGSGNAKQFNKEINRLLATNPDVNIIGLDRGEKNLIYYSVINQKREIIDQGSWNSINGVNYYEKLVSREKERLENRQSWNPITKIKDLKKGYVSQVVRKIADLVIQHNAIVVMEDLNMRFKQIRGGIERSVYQRLEKQLIDKFGYLVFKNRQPTEIGGVLCGYQLSAPFDTFEKMGKQTGIIFYTQADYTSITDPLTGFRKNIYISNSASQKTIAEAIDKFKSIDWDDKEQSYFFTYNPIDFVEEKYKKNTFSKEWTIYAKAPRIRREKDEKGYWQYQPINLNEKFKELFALWKFENVEGDIWEQLQAKETDGNLTGERNFDGKKRSFFHAFIYLFNLVLQLRNSYSEQWVTEEKDGKIIARNIEENIDFIASPVKPFFSTYSLNSKGEELSPLRLGSVRERIIAGEKERIIKEFNGDANGAYNIARKGIIILEAIKENPENPNLYVSRFAWDKFV